MEEAGLQLPDFEESDFYVEQEQVSVQRSLRTGTTFYLRRVVLYLSTRLAAETLFV